VERISGIKRYADVICRKSYIYFKDLKQRVKERIVRSTEGMGTIEVILIIAVLVALALIFRTFIGNVSSKIFNKIQEKTDSAIDDL
jgi:hypothetical protein